MPGGKFHITTSKKAGTISTRPKARTTRAKRATHTPHAKNVRPTKLFPRPGRSPTLIWRAKRATMPENGRAQIHDRNDEARASHHVTRGAPNLARHPQIHKQNVYQTFFFIPFSLFSDISLSVYNYNDISYSCQGVGGRVFPICETRCKIALEDGNLKVLSACTGFL